MGLADALVTLEGAVGDALYAAGYPASAGNTMRYWPDDISYLAKLPTSGQFVVSLYPVRDRDATRSFPARTGITLPPTPPLIAAVSGNAVTFSGSVVAGLNVHVNIDGQDAFHQTTAADTPATIAAALTIAVNALPLGYVLASASGATLTLTSARRVVCTVYASAGGSVVLEPSRTGADIQVTVFAADPDLRTQLRDAIVARVGTSLAHSYTQPDGTEMACLRIAGPKPFNDDAQDKNGSYMAALLFTCEFGDTFVSPATQVGSIETTLALNAAPPVTSFSSG